MAATVAGWTYVLQRSNVKWEMAECAGRAIGAMGTPAVTSPHDERLQPTMCANAVRFIRRQRRRVVAHGEEPISVARSIEAQLQGGVR
jgi:hypothetical protein